MAQHHFNTAVAKRLGIPAAVLFENIRFWCAHSKANGRNLIEGHHWVYNSVSAWSELFDYMTEKQIRTALEKLVEAKLIIKGCHNKDQRDRTAWYAVAEMQLPIWANEAAREGEPLPDNKPSVSNKDSSHPACAEVFNHYLEVAGQQSWVVHQKLTDALKKPLNARLNEYGPEKVKQFIDALALQSWTSEGFKGNPEFRASLEYIMRPSTFAQHFDKLVTMAPPPAAAGAPDLFATDAAQEEKLKGLPPELINSFRLYANDGRWLGYRYGFGLDPMDPAAKYDPALYDVFGISKPGA